MAIDAQELAWDDWNRVMRVRLEKYFRWTFIHTCAFIILAIVLEIFMFSKIEAFFHTYIYGRVALTLINLMFVRRLLKIKNLDKFRHWRR